MGKRKRMIACLLQRMMNWINIELILKIYNLKMILRKVDCAKNLITNWQNLCKNEKSNISKKKMNGCAYSKRSLIENCDRLKRLIKNWHIRMSNNKKTSPI